LIRSAGNLHALLERLRERCALSGDEPGVYGVSGSNGRYSLKTPETFIADGLAPADHRVPLPLALALAGVVALVAAIVQGTVGTIRWAIRRRRKRLRRPRSPSVSRPG